jgi:hypothetical protein
MAVHAKYSLRSAGISQVLDLSLAVATLEAASTECLISSEDGEVFDFVTTARAAVGTVVAYQRTVSKKEQVGI